MEGKRLGISYAKVSKYTIKTLKLIGLMTRSMRVSKTMGLCYIANMQAIVPNKNM